MTIDQIKNIISDNDAVLLWFGSNYEFACKVAVKTAGYISAKNNKEPYEHKEYVMLYLNGKYDGYNRDGNVEFFKIDFATGLLLTCLVERGAWCDGCFGSFAVYRLYGC